MPTAMSYAIDTIVRLVEENTRLKIRLGESADPIKLEVCEIETETPKKKAYYAEDDWDLLHEIEVNTLTEFLATEHSFHIYSKEPPTVAEVERLKESADLIAESQQKQINLLLEDKRERMEDRERLLKRICELEEEIGSHKGRGRPKKTECSPCIADPSP